MSFVFASSHLPESKRPQDEEEEEDVLPVLRSGGVRAFSHLPQPVSRDPAAPVAASPSGRSSWATEPEVDAAPEPDDETGGQFSSGHGAAEDTSPWYLPKLTHEYLRAQGDGSRGTDPGFGRPATDGRSTSHGSFGPAPSMQGSHDSAAVPDRATPPRGLWFQSRPSPGSAGPAMQSLANRPEMSDLLYRRPPQDANAPDPGRPGRLADRPEAHDLLYRFKGSPAEAKARDRSLFKNVADVHGGPPQLAAKAASDAQDEATQQGSRTDQTRSNNELKPQSPPPAAPASSPVESGEQEGEISEKTIPSTTIRIGNYPGFEKANPEKKELDDWNTTFRNTYGTLAVDAARRNGVPARLLAALSANEMAAENWTELNAFGDRNTLATKSVGPLQISSKTALRYKLVPIDNEFYGASQDERWTALHDPEVRHGESSPPSGLTPGQRLSYHQDNPYPNNPNGAQSMHDYLDNPATGFDAGAKLLKIYLARLVDDYKSGAYLNYSAGFRGLSGLSTPGDPIHKDLSILASGNKEAIYNLHFSERLAMALAMMWNNGEAIVNVENFNADAPNAYNHGNNMLWQHENQDDLIPAPRGPES